MNIIEEHDYLSHNQADFGLIVIWAETAFVIVNLC